MKGQGAQLWEEQKQKQKSLTTLPSQRTGKVKREDRGGAGEMAHQLRTQATLAKDLGSIPSTFVHLTTVSNFSGRRSDTLTQTRMQAEHKGIKHPIQPRWRPRCFIDGGRAEGTSGLHTHRHIFPSCPSLCGGCSKPTVKSLFPSLWTGYLAQSM